jgi:hypothetical protein
MAIVTRHIGLSLGADICWPLAFEEILAAARLELDLGHEVVRFACERVPLVPFTLARGCKYDVVVDRLTHWFALQREWIKQAVLLDGLYVYNNPWSVEAYTKHSSYCAMQALGMPIPPTAMLPQKRYEYAADLDFTLRSYARLFDIAALGAALGYPVYLKPHDGGGWQGVSRAADGDALRGAYDRSGTRLMHVQRSIEGYEQFVRAIGIGPQVRLMRYEPERPLHERYRTERGFCSAGDEQVLVDICLTINAFFGWDFNSVEVLRKEGVFHPIDFANACPDSQINSIHYHWPWYVIGNLKWAVFVAATKRPMPVNLDFAPFFAVARADIPYAEKLRRYGAIARSRLQATEFAEFAERHLRPLEQAACAWFASDRLRVAARRKVAHLYPAHEVDAFTDLFVGLVRRAVDDMAQGRYA